MDNEELKVCPFCGTMPKITPLGYVQPGCQCPGQTIGGITVDGWNTRPIEDALRAEVERLKAERRWISVEERLPDDDVWVLAYHGHEVFPTAHSKLGWYYECTERFSKITHWMPLPDPPETDAHKEEI